MIKFCAGITVCFFTLCAGYALASRNSSGTMSNINGPYIAGTVISDSIVNARLADIENELTDSLSRSGKGGMTASLTGANGTVSAPSYAWTSEPGSGLYRISAGDIGFAILGVKKLELTGTLFTVTPDSSFTGKLFSNAVTANPSIGFATRGANTATLANIQQGVSSNAAAIESTKTIDSYLPGFIWYTSDDNPTKPKAGIWVQTKAVGSHLFLGTSNNYAIGITNAAIDIDQAGLVTMTTGSLTVGASGTAVVNLVKGTCSLNVGSPSQCTASVPSGSHCVCSVEATSGSLGCESSVSSTTLTVTTANGTAANVAYICTN